MSTALEAHLWRRSRLALDGDLTAWIPDGGEAVQDEAVSSGSSKVLEHDRETECACMATLNAFGQTRGYRCPPQKTKRTLSQDDEQKIHNEK